MLYNERYRFIFIHVPRTGGASIASALRSDAVLKYELLHQSIREVFALLPCVKDYRSFGFARNPFSRMVSWYGLRVGYRHPLAPTRDEFKAFLRQLDRKHTRPAWDYLAGEVSVDRVGRFETLQEDFSSICAWLGINATLGHEHNSNTPVHWSEYYDDWSRDFVLKRCAMDFEKFGYSTSLV